MSGFRLLVDGADSFALRLQIAEKAEKTLDVQYFVLQQDDTGQLLLGALLDAAARGIRVRILLDDALGIDGGDTPAARGASEHRDPHLQSVSRAARVRVPAGARVLAAGWKARLPDAQQALCRRQRNRRDGRQEHRRRVLPGERRARVRRLRPCGRGPDGEEPVANVRPVLERSPRDSRRDTAVRRAVDRRPREGPRRARRAPPEDGRDFGVLQRDFPAISWADILSGKRPLVWAKAILAYDSPDKASVESPARSRRASTPSRTRQTATRSSWPREARRTLPWSNGAVWRTAAW